MDRSAMRTGRSPRRRGPTTMMMAAAAAVTLTVGGIATDAGAVAASQWNGTNAALSATDGPEVDAMATIGTDLYASGIFDTAGGLTVSNIARFDGQQWWPLGDPTTDGPVGTPVWTLLAVGTDLYAGVDGAIWQYDTLTSTWTDLGANSDMSVTSLAWYDDGTDPAYLVAGGSSLGGSACYVEGFDGTTWTSLPTITYTLSIPGSGGWNGCYIESLAVMGNDLYVGGVFDEAGGVPAYSIAKFDGTAFSAIGSGGNGVLDESGAGIDAAPVGDVMAMTVTPDGGSLVFGGFFSHVNGIVDATDPAAQLASGDAAKNLAIWDGTTLAPFGGSDDPAVFPNPDEAINALLFAADGSLYASGGLTFPDGGFGIGRLADVSGADWLSVGYGTDDVVLAMVEQDDSIWAGGYFTTAYSDDAPTTVAATEAIARWGLPHIAPQVTASHVTGKPVVGEQLTLTLTVTGSPTPTVTRQWLRCTAPVALNAPALDAQPERLLPAGCTAIDGATGATYVVQPADVGKYLVVLVNATNSSGFALDVPATAVAVSAAAVTPTTTINPTLPATGSNGSLPTTALVLVTAGLVLLVPVRRRWLR